MGAPSGTDGLLAIIERFDQVSALVVGDVMLDRFVYGETRRISPEAPVPVLRSTHETRMLGGAGNVLRNLSALGVKAGLVSVQGDDATGQEIQALVDAEPLAEYHPATEAGRRSTLKTRYIAGAQQLLRADDEDTSLPAEDIYEVLLTQCRQHVHAYDALILSDYAKGALTPDVIRRLITIAHDNGKPVFVDPKQWDISLYRGATLLSPNEQEMEKLHRAPLASEQDMADVAAEWCQEYAIGHVLVTLGAKGMMLVNADGLQSRIKARARDVFDVSGAGDTVIATVATATVAGASLEEAARLANHAAGIVVGKLGTATIHRTDLKTAIHTAHITTGRSKILSRAAAQEQVQAWKARGLGVGFTNGCFDIVHAGHIASLSHCKEQCDRLVIAINSDASVRRLKGDARPVNTEMDRALLLAAISVVDMVVIFREDTPEALLEELCPDVLMKGEDYELDQIVGRDFVESYGGKVVRIPLVDGYSTTNTVQKIREGVL